MFLKSDTMHGYFPVKESAFTAGFYLTGAGREQIEPNQPYPRATHPDMYAFSWNAGRVLPEYQLVFVNAGEGEFESRQTGVVPIQAGMAMLLMPDVWHRYRPNPKTGWDEYWISFNGQIPHLWQMARVITPAAPLLKISRTKELTRRLEKIVQAAVAKPDDGSATSFCAMAALADIFSGASQASHDAQPSEPLSASPHSEDALVHAAMNLIWDYSHRDLSVGRIAEHLGITRRTLERHFQAAHGATVLEELTRCRLARAQRLLRQTHLPIKRIAAAAGFSGPIYMATVFRSKLNITPREYREAKDTKAGQ